jgi:hypothetical protein
MKKFIMMFAILSAALTLPAAATGGSARWLSYPTCGATTSSITCTGRAAALHPRTMPQLGAVSAVIEGEVHYTCSDPVWEFVFVGFPTFTVLGPHMLASVDAENGKTFSITYAPLPTPIQSAALAGCQGTWARNPSYYNVRVALGWGFGGAVTVIAAEAPIGTVSPG